MESQKRDSLSPLPTPHRLFVSLFLHGEGVYLYIGYVGSRVGR